MCGLKSELQNGGKKGRGGGGETEAKGKAEFVHESAGPNLITALVS